MFIVKVTVDEWITAKKRLKDMKRYKKDKKKIGETKAYRHGQTRETDR
jgi:hypothetical protein